MRMHSDREAKVAGQTLGNGRPCSAIIITSKHAERRVFKAAMVLHVKPLWTIGVRRNLVHALAEFGKFVGLKAGADSRVLWREALAAVAAGVVAARGDAQVKCIALAKD